MRRSAGGAVHQRHRLGGGGRLIEHRGIGDVQPGEVGDHGLEVQQRLQPALADLRLVRRVGGVPGRVLHDVAQQHRRREGVVVALPDHRHRDGVRIGQFAQFRERLVLGRRRRQALQPGGYAGDAERIENDGRQGLGGHFVEGLHTDDTQHGGQRIGVGSDVTGSESGIEVFGHLRHLLTRGGYPARAGAWYVLSLCRWCLRDSAYHGNQAPCGLSPWAGDVTRDVTTFQRHRSPRAVRGPERLTERCCSFGAHGWLPQNSPARGRCTPILTGRRRRLDSAYFAVARLAPGGQFVLR